MCVCVCGESAWDAITTPFSLPTCLSRWFPSVAYLAVPPTSGTTLYFVIECAHCTLTLTLSHALTPVIIPPSHPFGVQTKGTTSKGKKHNKVHTLCVRCGKSSYHLQRGRCASCGYPAARTRSCECLVPNHPRLHFTAVPVSLPQACVALVPPRQNIRKACFAYASTFIWSCH